MKIWLAYFKRESERNIAYEEAQIDGIDILVVGCGGSRPDSKLFFIIFSSREENQVQELQLFLANGATDVQPITFK